MVASLTVPVVGRLPASSKLLVAVVKVALRARSVRLASWAIRHVSFDVRVGKGRWQRLPLGLTIREAR